MQHRTLELSGDGSRLVATGTDHFDLVDLASRERRTLVRHGLIAVAVIGDEVWSVSGTPLGLEVEGHAERLPLPGRTGRFVRGNGAVAAWLAPGAAFQLVRTEHGIDATLVRDAELVLPLSATRHVVTNHSTIQLRDTTTTRWSVAPVVDGHATEGSAMFDGRAVALYLEQRQDRGTIVVLGLRDGGVQHRINVRGATCVRFAGRRGVAFVVLSRRRLVMLELRFGRILADHTLDRDIVDLATDDAGQRLALRHDHASGDIVELSTDELLRAPRVSSTAEASLDDEHATASPAAIPEHDPPPPPPPPRTRMARGSSMSLASEATGGSAAGVAGTAPAVALDLAPCPALSPRARVEAPTPDELRELLDAQRQLIVGLASYAVAREWDEGRAAPDRGTPARAVIDSLAGTVRGLASDDVAAGARRAETAVARWCKLVAELAPRTPPLLQLADELGLDTLAQQIVLVIAAPALWGEMAQLYGLLANDGARPLCDEHLVATILASFASPQSIAAALDPEGPLVRSGVVLVGDGLQRPFLPLSVDPIVLRLLRGVSPLGALGSSIASRAMTTRFEELHVAAAVKARIREDLARASGPLRVVVRGRAGSGRHTLLAAIAGATQRALGVIDASVLLAGPHPHVEELALALRRAQLAGLVPCIDGLERGALQDPVLRERIRTVIRHHAGPVMVRLATHGQAPVDPGHVAIDLPPQTVAERAHTWDRALSAAQLVVADTSELAARFGVGPAVITRVVERVARMPGPDVAGQLERELRQHLDGELGAIATRVTRLATWSQVVLPPDIQDSVTELIGRIRHRRMVFDTWGFDRVMSTSRGITALFQGGPGTGKTLVAGAIASELGLDLYRVDVSRIMSKWVGETEQNLAKLFDAAEDGNAIILFDEADSLFAKRTEVKSSNDRFANLEVNYLLQRLDSFEGIAIMTTNFGTSIDSAFKRRLSFRLTFPFPDEEQREQLWRAHLPEQLPIRGALDLASVAQRYRISGGYIRNCALRAAFLAAEQGGVLTADHLERAIRAEFREIGKLAETGVLE